MESTTITTNSSTSINIVISEESINFNGKLHYFTLVFNKDILYLYYYTDDIRGGFKVRLFNIETRWTESLISLFKLPIIIRS